MKFARLIVYVSAYQQYALECCRFHAFDFLLKPLLPEQLRDCMVAILRDIEFRAHGTMLNILMGTKQTTLRQEDILYFHKGNNHLAAVCHEQAPITWRENFSALEARISQDLFFKCTVPISPTAASFGNTTGMNVSSC